VTTSEVIGPSDVPAKEALYDGRAGDVELLDLLQFDHRRAANRRWLIHRMLLVADVLSLLLAFICAKLIDGLGNAYYLDSVGRELLFFVGALPVWVVLVKLYGLYDRDDALAHNSTVDDLPGAFHVLTFGSVIVFGIGHLLGVYHWDLRTLFAFGLFAIAFVIAGRLAVRAICRRLKSLAQNTLIVGAGEVGQLIAKKLANHPEYHLDFVGFVDTQPRPRPLAHAPLELLGTPQELPEIVRRHEVDRVIIAFPSHSDTEMIDLIRLTQSDIQIDVVPRLFENLSRTVAVHAIEGIPLLGLAPPRLSRSSNLIKRVTDIALSIPLLVLLSPLFAVVATLIKLDSRGPVFFRQVRVGAEDLPFRIYKFRTMYTSAEARKGEVAHLNKHAQPGGDPRMFKIPDDPRVTRFGRFLRKTSLDELPQFLNVLKGEMSLVGPRPLILEEDRHVDLWARKRLSLKPGITGLWQVLGRDEIPFAEMVRLDYLYVTNWSFWQDISLLLQTLPLVFSGRSHAH
jgi:exopolysaccharide biosynthesis polyprenyl glycosylphosphotransferase